MKLMSLRRVWGGNSCEWSKLSQQTQQMCNNYLLAMLNVSKSMRTYLNIWLLSFKMKNKIPQVRLIKVKRVNLSPACRWRTKLTYTPCCTPLNSLSHFGSAPLMSPSVSFTVIPTHAALRLFISLLCCSFAATNHRRPHINAKTHRLCTAAGCTGIPQL